MPNHGTSIIEHGNFRKEYLYLKWNLKETVMDNYDNMTPEELYNLGQQYEWGLGKEQDYEKAIDYFKKANQVKGYSAPYYYLGDCYHHGLGVKPDWHKAKKYYEKAIELGYNCEYALDMVKIDLGEYRKVAEMEKYAKSCPVYLEMLIPASLAASGLPPTAYNLRPTIINRRISAAMITTIRER